MSPGEVRGAFLRVASLLRTLAEERLAVGDDEGALVLAEESDRALRQAQAALQRIPGAKPEAGA